ncbi:MAG: hypothetical protein K2Z81_06885, partial [Cyanobacteria bacterium]|nr:hypothetical protein [Cyanobacteriota bacterium]
MTLDNIDRNAELEQEASIGLHRYLKPRVVAIIPSRIASCRINVEKPLEALARAGRIKFRSVLESQATRADIGWADAVVFCRNTEPQFNFLLIEAIARQKGLIYDLDDSFWDVPPTTDPALSRYHRQPVRLRQFEQYLSLASLVRVYSPTLEAKVACFNQNARLRRSSFDFSCLRKMNRADDSSFASNERAVKIVYATSRTRDDLYRLFLPGLL